MANCVSVAARTPPCDALWGARSATELTKTRLAGVFAKNGAEFDNSLQKRQGGVTLIPMLDRTLAMSTAIIPGLPGLFRPARRFRAVDLRIEDGLFRRMLSEKGLPKK